jgi:hypothetical protein
VGGRCQALHLLTAPYGFVNAALAKVYGVRGPSDASFSKVDFDPDPAQRSVDAGQPADGRTPARNTSSPVKRGKWVRTRMLCHDLPEPPGERAAAARRRRQGVLHARALRHAHGQPALQRLPQLIDGLGFGLERYDGIGAPHAWNRRRGRRERRESRRPCDIDGPYEGGPALARCWPTASRWQNCAPTQWLRYSLGGARCRRHLLAGRCARTFRSQGGDLKQLMVALAQSDALLNYRKPDEEPR